METGEEMRDDDRFEFDSCESGFTAQLSSVLMTVAAVGVIIFVNARAPDPSTTAASSKVQEEAAQPAVRRQDLAQPQAALVPMTAQRASLPL